MMKKLITTGVFASVALAACGGSGGPEALPAAPVEPVPAASGESAAAAFSVSVKAGSSEIGDVLTGPEGLTLYGFTNDVDAKSACYGTCADAWPPVIVPLDWTAGPGLDFGIFATTVREDGQLQLVAGKWPLYYFAGDASPGDVKGQDSGGVWFAVDLNGRLITEASPVAPVAADAEEVDVVAVVETANTDAGEALVDANGLTLYGFTQDVDAVPTCNDACADAWPPLIVEGTELPAGLDAAVFSLAERADGSMQLIAGVWPLYRFAGDAEPGDINGQESGGVWFIAAPDGSLIKTEGGNGY